MYHISILIWNCCDFSEFHFYLWDNKCLSMVAARICDFEKQNIGKEIRFLEKVINFRF